MLLTLLGTVLGGLFRLAPELLALFKGAKDADHEYRMAQLSAASSQRLAEIQGATARDAGELQALVEAVRGQARPSGIRWVDAVSATVRPVVTYWWVGLYTAYKGAQLTAASAEQGALGALMSAWTVDDQTILASILSFWFVDRMLRRHPIR